MAAGAREGSARRPRHPRTVKIMRTEYPPRRPSPAPYPPVDVGAAHDTILAQCQDQQDLELPHRETHATAVREDLDLIGADLEVAVHKRPLRGVRRHVALGRALLCGGSARGALRGRCPSFV